MSVATMALGWTGAAAVAAPSAAPAAASTPVMVVLDASGSMNTADAPGPRISAAKQAVYDLVDSLPAGAQVGLMVYGTGTDSSDAAKAAGCRDIKSVVGLGPVNKTSFKAAVAGITAHGYTPIGNALKAASATLPSTGPRSIVLVSDGEDTCAPPAPCDVAKTLNAAGTDLTVHTVGFKVDATARSQLTCIASATNGSYRETSQGGELGKILINRVGVALRPYTAVGTPVTGATGPVGAPALKPGQYVDSFKTTDDKNPLKASAPKFYTVTLGAGETLHATVTLAMPPVAITSFQSVGVAVELLTPDGATCATESVSAYPEDAKIRPITAVLSVAPGEQSATTSYCDQKQGQFVLRLRRTGAVLPTQAINGEIRVRVEPVASADGVPAPAYKALPAISPPADSTPTTTDGGSSFDNAPLLKPGTYKDLVVSGETRYYRVHVDWGQRLTYRVGVPGAQVSATKKSVYVRSFVASPLRETVPSSGSQLAFYYGDEPKILHGSSDFPARYTNRVSANSSARGFSVDGDYYVVFNSGFSTGSLYQLPVTLTVATDGTTESGPVYGRAGSLIPTATPSASPTPSTRPSGSSASGSSATGSGGAIKTGSDGNGGGVAIWVWPVGAAVVLGAAGTGLVVARRRRVPIQPQPGQTDQFTRPQW